MELERDGTVFAYTLDDAREHLLTLRLHGAKYLGAREWTSNTMTLRVSPRRP